MALDIDLSQFHEIFYEESLEGLEAMEAGLLNLNLGTPDAEIINNVFRAAHSIKGGAGTFGMTDIAQFTHILETTLDDVRSRKRGVTQELVDVLLKSVDCLRYMIDCSKRGTTIDKTRLADLIEKLGTIEEKETEADKKSPTKASGWRIIFTPALHLLQTGNEPYRLFRELSTLGTLQVTADISRLPDFDNLDPEQCYLGWEVLVTGDTSLEKINEIFEWVEGDCVLEITLQGDRRQFVERREARSRDQDETDYRAQEATSIRVNIEKVDGLINLVGELVIAQSILNQVTSEVVGEKAQDLVDAVEVLVRNTRDLQEQAMRIRMLPIDFTFNRLPRLVRDLKRSLGKQVNLVISGNSTEVDKTVLEKISDPLVHLIRNAVDHGIEKPEIRLEAGKAEEGQIEVRAAQEGGSIIITINDDGAGLNQEKLLAKARELELVGQNEELTPVQIQHLIFHPGFSTTSEVSSVSGRGVGMDVVKRNITALGGSVELSSELGKGTRFTIKLPLTLAILDGQLISVGKETLVIPLLNIVESVQPNKTQVLEIAGETEVFRFRDQYLPVIRLYETFGIPTVTNELFNGLLVIADAGDQRVALFVDDVLGQQQVVIKSLEANYHHVPGLSGATILGDGTVAMIIDIVGLVQLFRGTTHKRAA